MLSATFHAAVAGLLILFGLESCQQDKPQPRVLELVAGQGDNFGATVAPKLGTPGGVKVDLPAIPIPKAPDPEPVAPPPPAKAEPLPPEPSPITPPPPQPKTPPPPPKKTEPTTPNFAKQVLRKALNAERKAKAEVAKERAAEEKRLKKEEFDRQQRAKVAAATKGSSAKVSHIDAEGIAKGVVGGSAENKVGGAGGKALTAMDGALAERYFAMLKQRVLSALDKPPGVSDDLVVTVVVHISASGRLSNARVVKSSGSEEFDRAVITAFSRVTMPEHPEHKNEDLELVFKTRDVEGG